MRSVRRATATFATFAMIAAGAAIPSTASASSKDPGGGGNTDSCQPLLYVYTSGSKIYANGYTECDDVAYTVAITGPGGSKQQVCDESSNQYACGFAGKTISASNPSGSQKYCYVVTVAEPETGQTEYGHCVTE